MCYRLHRAAIALLALPALLGSCQDEDFGYTTEDIRHQETVKDYALNFIDRYGLPAANHTWGFGQASAVDETGGATRAYVAGDGATIDAQRGKWPTELAPYVTIPGWPNFDGYYYSSQGGGSNLGAINKTDKGTPCGDVTEFEIQYVSAWFRTNYISEDDMMTMRESIHWTDYFIQNVCQDDDQVEYRDLPAGQVTGNNGANKKSNESQGVYLQSVYFKPFGVKEYGNPESDWINFSNFDHSNAPYNPEDHPVKDNNAHRMIQYIHGGGTEDFCCKFGNDLQYNWVLKRLTWTEIGADNLAHERTGYYLAFDYVPKGDSYGDGHFSNWIIKISPATLAPDPDPVPPYPVTRVMCEDLGNSFDFDFNDVVFDVKHEGTSAPYTAVINLQAAGGTLPIYVGLTPEDLNTAGYKEQYEAHYLLGGSSPDSPINVSPAGSTQAIAIYRLGGFTSNSAYDVPVTVIKNGLAYNIVNGQTPVGEPDYSQGTGHTGAGAGSASTIINTDSNVP